ncbi:MAG: peptidylprolyl isomerase [Fibrobacteres bacterium]|nr:peptidylprolyl isomerase [Fibrobacterota bacterium]
MKIKLLQSLLILALTAYSAQTKLLDRIIAVVDDQIVLESELNEMTYFTFQSMGKAVPVNSDEFDVMRSRVLNSLIEDKLIVKEAEAESISVSPDEIKKQRDGQIDSYIQKMGSKEALEAELKKSYGLTLPKLKKQLEEQIREQSLKMQLAQKIRMKINISREDVTAFLAANKDSLPKEKESIMLAHIQKEIMPADAIVKAAEVKIRLIEEEAAKGAAFPDLAKKYSEDPSASLGGDLGFFEKGFLDPAFERAAFALNVGDVSSPVRSSYGYHLIKLEERKDNSIRVRHILLLVRPSSEDTLRAQKLCDSIAANAVTDSAFKKAASIFSDDKLTRDKGGVLGWLPADKLGKEYKDAVSDLKQSENSRPVLLGNSYHIFRMIERMEERPLTLADDYETLKNLALNSRMRDELSQRAERIKKRIHVENRLVKAEKSPK